MNRLSETGLRTSPISSTGVLNLPDDLATRRLLTENEASNGHDDDEQGSDRK
jgi:hypothetical protein